LKNYEALSVEVRDHILEMTFTRPELHNRVDLSLHSALIETFGELRSRPEIRAVVLASTGKTFSAGGDLNEIFEMQKDPALRMHWGEQGIQLLQSLLDVPVPIIVALHGDAYGMGANIVLSCDAVVACKSARLADTHVPAGMVAGDGGCVVWPQSMGMMWAKRYLLTGDRIGAEQAYARGLVTDLVDTPAECLPAARALAEHIAALPPLAVQNTKRALNRVMQQRSGEVFEYSMALEQMTIVSDDIREAVNAFLEKRKPLYQGR
jgi:enoyl-CoA hydratase